MWHYLFSALDAVLAASLLPPDLRLQARRFSDCFRRVASPHLAAHFPNMTQQEIDHVCDSVGAVIQKHARRSHTVPVYDPQA